MRRYTRQQEEKAAIYPRLDERKQSFFYYVDGGWINDMAFQSSIILPTKKKVKYVRCVCFSFGFIFLESKEKQFKAPAIKLYLHNLMIIWIPQVRYVTWNWWTNGNTNTLIKLDHQNKRQKKKLKSKRRDSRNKKRNIVKWQTHNAMKSFK